MPLRMANAFGDDDDAEMLACRCSAADGRSDSIEIIGQFRDQDDISPAAHAGMEGDPASITPHHFYHHQPMM